MPLWSVKGVAGDAMSEKIKSYEDLDVWKLGVELSIRCYRMVRELPDSEKYGLSSQMRRCAVSIPANIAEGHARRQPKPFLNHVNIALGSLAEWVTYLVVAERLHFISREVLEAEKSQADTLGRRLHALANSLDRRVQGIRLGVITGVLGVIFLVRAVG
jgi:four helix bundle protein